MRVKLILLLAWFCIGALAPVIWTTMLLCIPFNTERALEIAIAYDRLGNAAMGQGSRETISSWSGKRDGWQERFINWIFRHLTGEQNHCDKYRETR